MGPHWKTSPQRAGPGAVMVPASKLSSSARPQNKQPVGWPRRHGLLARAPAVSKSRSVFREEMLGELDKVFAKLGTLALSSPCLSCLCSPLLCVLKNENDFWPHLLLASFLQVSKVNGLFAPFLDFHNKCKWWTLTRMVKPEQEFQFSFSFDQWQFSSPHYLARMTSWFKGPVAHGLCLSSNGHLVTSLEMTLVNGLSAAQWPAPAALAMVL